jgi:signal transduction histidine kinase
MRVTPVSHRKLEPNGPKDTLTGGISVEVVYGEENVCLRVSDTGVGIPPQGISLYCHPIES